MMADALTTGQVSAVDVDGDQKTCFCGEPSGLRLYCPRCEGLLGRGRKGYKPDMGARRNALHAQWNKGRKAFICKYTGISLTDKGGATNAEWEHVIPKDESSVVLVAALVNRMKADLTVEQWDAIDRRALRPPHQAQAPQEGPPHQTQALQGVRHSVSGRLRRVRGAKTTSRAAPHPPAAARPSRVTRLPPGDRPPELHPPRSPALIRRRRPSHSWLGHTMPSDRAS